MGTSVDIQTPLVLEHKRIRALRRQLELSQLEVALHAGISQSQYSLFEQGYARLGPDVLQLIQLFLKQVLREEADHA